MFFERLKMKFSPSRATRKMLRQKMRQAEERQRYEQALIDYKNISYSQEGEDLIINGLLDEQKTGFYVDVGAHHPFRFSNTAFFYQKGWTGINIDPLPGVKKLFDEHRPNDVNLELGISNVPEPLTYYMFEDPAYNGFCETLTNERIELNIKPIGTTLIECSTLAEVLNVHVPDGQIIDFLSIDAEGLDFAVLQSNNWEKYSPRLIIIEILGSGTIEDLLKSEVATFLSTKNYALVAKSIRSVFFKLLSK